MSAHAEALGVRGLVLGFGETDVLKGITLISPARSVARVTNISRESLKIPKRTGTFSAARTAELATRSETTGYATGMLEIPAPEMYALTYVSQQFLEDYFFILDEVLVV